MKMLQWAAAAFVVVALGDTLSSAAYAQDRTVEPTSASSVEPARATVTVDAAKVLREFDPRALAGTNVAAWTGADYFTSPQVRALIDDLQTGVVRLPGGSWGDAIFWNGNGVRRPDGTVDPTRMGPEGYPAIDYSDYAPSILAEQHSSVPRSDGWHGNVDVKALHEFVEKIPDTEQMVIVNAGTGRPLDAAEWVKWANRTMNYGVKYWEIGNELDGGWESGHVLPDGSELTAEMYADRFRAFAEAMKAIDPEIQIGGATSGTDNGGFSEVMLREVGEHVDFVSVHIYPGNPMYSDAEQLARIVSTHEAAERVKGWIQKYQPDRADEIGMAITEWGLPGYPRVRDLFNAIWSIRFIQESALAGYDVMNQWYIEDMIRKDLLASDAQAYIPVSQYWGLWMWTHYTGPQIVSATTEGFEPLKVLASADGEEAVLLTLVNTDPERAVTTTLALRNFAPADRAERATLGARSYFLNPVTQKVLWSNRPEIEAIDVGDKLELTIPPYAIVGVRVPAASAPALSPLVQPAQEPKAPANAAPELRLILPPDAYANETIRGNLIATIKGTDQPFLGELPPATVRIGEGEQEMRVDLGQSVAPLSFQAGDSGSLAVTASAGEVSTTATINIKPSIPQPQVVWEFEQLEQAREGYSSDWTLSADTSVRANQRVARIDVPQGARGEKRFLLKLENFPDASKLNKGNIRGIFFDLKTAPNFVAEDPNARVTVVMQSPADWWMILGSVPLSQAKEWGTHTFQLTQEKHLSAIPFAHNVLFILESEGAAHGSVYIDRVGFMVR